MDRNETDGSWAVPPVSTHVAFCAMLETFTKGQPLFTEEDIKTKEQKAALNQSAAPPDAAIVKSVAHEFTEQNSKHRIYSSQDGAMQSHRNAEKRMEMMASYQQVVKEAVTAFTGRQLHHDLLMNSTNEITPPTQHQAPAADRQNLLRRGMSAFVNAVAVQESDMQKLAASCRERLPLLNGNASDEVKQLALARQVPLQSWAGWYRYNSWFVKCAMSSSTKEKVTQRKKSVKGESKTSSAEASLSITTPPEDSATRQRAPFPASVVPTTAPKTLVQSADLERELQRYWKLHDEAAARARLEALRSNDAEAFAEHVSLLKVSALLEIMERTEGFMRRIGMRLESQTADARRVDSKAPLHDDPTTPTRPSQQPQHEQQHHCLATGRKADNDYARFRAYVASSKNEFKLVHRLDVFVSSQPRELRATLLPHQMDGLRFLASLHANHINGILADEMGVGKTIQTLAFLLYLKEMRQQQEHVSGLGNFRESNANLVSTARPHLVLAPLSVIREWREACEQFVSDSFRVGLFQELADPVQDAPTYDLLLMPVHAVRHAGAAAARVQWNYIVVDEAHKAVANLQTITAQAILALPCDRRLVLTGTPLSSDLQELWSLLHFLNPGVFSDNDAFEQVFRRPFQVYDAKEVELTEEERGLLVLRLHQVLRPFLLRRTKADIDAALRMTFHVVQCPLTAVQRRVLGLLREEKRTPAVLHESSSSVSSEDEEGDNSQRGGAEAAFPLKGTASVAEGAFVKSGNAGTPEVVSVPEADALRRLVQRYLPGLAATSVNAQTQRSVATDRGLGLSSAHVSESVAQQVCNHAFLLPFFSQVLQRHKFDELTLETNVNETIRTRRASTRTTRNQELSNEEDFTEVRGAAAMTLACSGKFLLLHLLLSRLFVAGHKVVLFTHWLSCVDLLTDYLHSRGWAANTEILTGANSEAERKASVRRFREDPACLFFLLSMKAGGCGINLQAAHVVVLLDRDYTATNEDQALARVYRIGQPHTVRALFFTTDDASEARVMERAESKNRPRRAIIDNGVYQVTGAAAKDAEEEMASNADDQAELAEVKETHTEDIDAACIWRSVAPLTGAKKSENDQEIVVADRSCASTDASVPGEFDFWTELRRLVAAFDELVLTDEDREAAAQSAGCGCGAHDGSINADAPSVKTPSSVMHRLQSTIPPASLEMLESSLRQMQAVHDAAQAVSIQSPQRERSAAGEEESDSNVDAAQRHSEALLNANCEESITNVPSPNGAALPLIDLKPQSTSLNPLQASALFWLEFAHLIHTSCEGPVVLASALDAAVWHDTNKDDAATQQRRRQRRDRRAAKRMRLATVDVPDAFREKCFEDDGVEDDAEVAARYLRHLDERASPQRRKQKPRTK